MFYFSFQLQLSFGRLASVNARVVGATVNVLLSADRTEMLLIALLDYSIFDKSTV